MKRSLRRFSTDTDGIIISEESIMDRERGAIEEVKRGSWKEGYVMGEGDGLRVKYDSVRRYRGRNEVKAIEDKKVMRRKCIMTKTAKLWFKDSIRDRV